MTISLFEASVGNYLQGLPPLAALVEKAETYCKDKGLPDTALTEARLAPDMWVFAKQVTSTVHHSAGTVAALKTGVFRPDIAPPPTSFAPLKALVADAIESLQSASPDEINALAGGDMLFVFGERRMPFTAENFVLSFSLPNFYFHCTAAYAVLRNQGLPVGKMDFIGMPRLKM